MKCVKMFELKNAAIIKFVFTDGTETFAVIAENGNWKKAFKEAYREYRYIRRYSDYLETPEVDW